jgi:glycosyltransferase involved in cell wall biosynthesis
MSPAQRRPSVSVCLLAYNHEKLIASAIESVLAQTRADFELIVSDDQSRDGTFQVIEACARRDPRIRAVRTPRNLGMAGNANFAVSRASAPYVALLHHDDLYAPQLLERWLDVAQRHPAVGFVSNAYGFDGDDRIDYHPLAEFNDGQDVLRRVLLPGWGCAVRGTALIRTECWNELGGMREEFGMLADVDLWMRLSARWPVGYVREPLIVVRQERPDDYPKDYSEFSWKRMRLLHEIHAANWRATYGDGTLDGRVHLAWFRARRNADVARWLLYAIAKRRWQMLATSDEVGSAQEYTWLRRSRKTLAWAARALRA